MNIDGFRRYKYVGPEEIRQSADSPTRRIRSMDDLREILQDLDIISKGIGKSTATFIVDSDGFLHLAHRRSEHVACAGGEDVLSAGEMTFGWNSDNILVENVTNQSTGYCPEPESWAAVSLALERIGLHSPMSFSPEFIFRRCPRCHQTNLVKDSHFYCGVCAAELPKDWNFY